ETDPSSSKEFLKRELEADPYVIKVSVGQHTPIATDTMVVETEVTRKEQYLVWGHDIPPKRLHEWKMDAAQQWLVSTFGNGLIAYDFFRALQMPIQTRLPVE